MLADLADRIDQVSSNEGFKERRRRHILAQGSDFTSVFVEIIEKGTERVGVEDLARYQACEKDVGFRSDVHMALE